VEDVQVREAHAELAQLRQRLGHLAVIRWKPRGRGRSVTSRWCHMRANGTAARAANASPPAGESSDRRVCRPWVDKSDDRPGAIVEFVPGEGTSSTIVAPNASRQPRDPHVHARAAEGHALASSSARCRCPLASEPSARTIRCQGTAGSWQPLSTAPAKRGEPGDTSP
jgi:hypothetical protein